MTNYRVQFYQNTYAPDGHSIKQLKRQVDVEADSPSHALVLAEAELEGALEADSIEVHGPVAATRAGAAGHTPRAA